MEKTYIVDGMSCQGCVKGLTASIQQELSGASVSIDLESKAVTVSPADDDAVRRAVDNAGFDFMGTK